MTETPPAILSHFDGYRGGSFDGWAYRPEHPDDPVVVEILVDGVLVAEAVASEYRPDLRAAGVGHGRFAFSVPYEIDLERGEPVNVVVRAQGGPALTNGQTQVGGALALSEDDAAAFKAFVASVLGRAGDSADKAAAEATPYAPPLVNFIVHSPTGAQATAEMLGAAEYSYGFVLRAFRPLLERFGEVCVVADPAREVDALYEAHLARREVSLFLSFAPPHRTVLGLRAPTVPVIAWEYPTIPDEVWEGERRHDWRWVLRQTGRAITLSRLAAQAVKAAMGVDFPVVSIPAPVWDRQGALRDLPLRAPGKGAALAVEGFIFDSRQAAFASGMATPAPPPEQALPTSAEVEGVVFTSVLSPKDGRKNWPDIVTAFITAMSLTPDATLVLKMIGSDPAAWWWEFYDRVSRMPPFQCRIVVINGYMDDARYAALIAATGWVVNASVAEGLCLPLVEFMCADRPAVSPRHTAMADYIDASCALIVQSQEEYCGWPHDTRMGMTTARHRVAWSSLRNSLSEAYRIAKFEPERHAAMARAAGQVMQAFCSDAVVADKLDAFLGLGMLEKPGAPASELLAPGAAG